MRRNLWLLAVTALLASCTPQPQKACVPNDQKSCACPGGGTGIQVCTASGDAYGACEACGGAQSSSGGSSGGATSSFSGSHATSTGTGSSTAAQSSNGGTGSSGANTSSNSGATSSSSGGPIHSTAAGGLWFDTTTWVGGVVPLAGDDVIVDGEVQVNVGASGQEAACRNININASAVLRAEAYATRTLHVTGNLSNWGPVRNGPNYASYDTATLRVDIAGNFFQGASWSPSTTHFTGTAEQVISQAAAQVLSGDFVDDNPASPLWAGADLVFGPITWTLGGATLDLRSYNITLSAGDFHVVGGPTRAQHLTGVSGATFTVDHVVASQGTLTIDGDFRTSNLSLEGNLVVAAGAALYNQANMTSAVVVTGDVQVNGILRRGPGYAAFGEGDLTLQLTGNLTVNGQYTPTSTAFAASGEQTITLVPPQVLVGVFSDATPASPLRAAGNLDIGGAEFALGVGGSLNLGGHLLSHSSGDLKIVTGSLDADDITGGPDGASTFSVAAIHPPSGTVTLHGNYRTGSMAITGNLVVASDGVLYNQENVQANVTVSGTVGGSGVIRSGPGYASYDSGHLILNGVTK